MTPPLATKAELLAAQAEDLDCFSGLKLSHVRAGVSEILGHIGREGVFYEYTKHDISHVDEMLRMLDWVIPEATWHQLTPTDALLHVLSIYFHDLGLVVTRREYDRRDNSGWRAWVDQAQAGTVGADYRAHIQKLSADDRERFLYQDYVRAHHGERVRMWINGAAPPRLGIAPDTMTAISGLLGHLPVAFREDLGRICESHHRSDLGDVNRYGVVKAYGASSAEEANVQYAAFMLRTVDLLDITTSRTPSVAFRLIAPSDPISQIEWAKQRAVTAVRPKPGRDADGNVDATAPRDTVQVFAHFTSDSGFFALIAYLAYARSELHQTYAWAREATQRHGSTYEFPWRTIDDSEIRTSGFQRQSLEFSLDAGRVLDLLTGHTLYDNTAVIVRELVQNALDATRAHRFEYPDAPGEVNVSWNQQSRILSVSDTGTGMTQMTIERHLLRVGSSRYQDPEFIRTHPGFAPISRFGIGILSTFMVADSVTITTLTPDEHKGRQLHLRSVHGRYLVRTFDRDDEIAREIGQHGTKVTVRLRPSATLEDVRAALELWVVVPGCVVNLTVDNGDPIPIGHSTIGAALRSAIDGDKDVVRPGQSVEIVEERVEGVEVAYARQWSPVFNEWQLVTRSERSGAPPLGLCVQGIRIDFNTPGFTGMPFYAMADATGIDAPRTDVTRTTLEQTEERWTLLTRVFGAYAKFVSEEVAALANRGYSLTWQARSARELARPIGSSMVIDPTVARSALATIPAIVIDDGTRRRLCTGADIDDYAVYWTVRSHLFDSVERVLMELRSDASVLTVTSVAGGTSIEFPPGPVVTSTAAANSAGLTVQRDIAALTLRPEERRLDIAWARRGETPRWRSLAAARVPIERQGPARRRILDVEPAQCFVARPGTVKVEGRSDETVIFDGGWRLIIEGSPLHAFLWDVLERCALTNTDAELANVIVINSVLNKVAEHRGAATSAVLSVRRDEVRRWVREEFERTDSKLLFKASAFDRAITAQPLKVYDLAMWERKD
jgi:molecular chaperone HtpG